MNRRVLLAGVGAKALVSEPASAHFARGGAVSSQDGATIAPAIYPTTNVLGGDYIPVSVRWTGVAPSSIISAAWSGSGGSATILGGSFRHTGQTAQFKVSTPSPASMTTYDLSVIADTGAGTTFSGISVTPPLTDMAAGIYGPTTVYWDQSQPIRNNSFSLLPIAAYFTRGLPGVLTAAITDTVSGSGDAAYFTLASKLGGHAGGLTTGFNLCPTYALLVNRTQTSFAIDISISNGIVAPQVIHVVVRRPATNAVSVYAWDTVYGGAYFTHYLSNQIILDSTKPQENSTVVDAVQLLTNAAGITFTPDAGRLFSFTGGSNGTVQINQANLTKYGHHTCAIQAAGGPLQTLDFWIVKTRPPVVEWRPNGTIYSSTPPTTGFEGSNLIGTIAAYADEHGQVATSSSFRYEIVSDLSGALQIWNTGQVYLSTSVSAGTIDTVIRITSASGITQLITLSLPVLAGTTLAASNINPALSRSLTNFVPYANPIRNKSTSFPYGNPVPVGTFTVSGFSNPINWTKVQTALVLGPTFDNAQVANGGDPGNLNINNGFVYNIPRYIVTGSGTRGTITATNLSATSKDTPQVDTLRVQLTDGLGTYCTKDIPITVAWHTPKVPLVTVGPGGMFATPLLMGRAFWADFLANGAASIYAGTTIKPLPRCDVISPNGFCYGPGGGGSGFSNGWWPFPVAFINDTTTQWSGNATISGTTLTVNITVSGSIKVGDYLTSGVGGAAVMIMSGSGSSWTVQVGPDPISATLSIGPATMTTATPRTFLDFVKTTPGGGSQGGIMKAGYDLDIRGLELANCTLAYGMPPGPNYISADTNAGAIYMVATQTGNLWVQDCYIHDCDVTILNGGPGNHLNIQNCILMHSGNAQGTQHNIYTDTVAKLTFTHNQCGDTFAGHEFKTRAMQAIVTDNIFAEGPNGQGSCPINYTFNGNMQFLRNIVTKTVNDNVSKNSLYHQVNDELNGGQGVTGDSIGWTWPYQNGLIDSCQYFNLIPRATEPFQAIQCFSSLGIQLLAISGPGGFQGDPIRNTPMQTTITNTGFGNMQFPAEFCFTFFGGVAPTLGAGNHTLTNFPASAIELVDPITGTPPFRLPRQGPFGYFFGGHQTSTIGSSPGVYYMSLTVPRGSPPGTNVIGGLLTGYDGNFAPLRGATYSFNNDYKTDNARFTFTTTANGIQLKTNGALSDGLYLVTLQCVGAGWNSRTQANGTITSITSFRVIVGKYV